MQHPPQFITGASAARLLPNIHLRGDLPLLPTEPLDFKKEQILVPFLNTKGIRHSTHAIFQMRVSLHRHCQIALAYADGASFETRLVHRVNVQHQLFIVASVLLTHPLQRPFLLEPDQVMAKQL